MIVTGVGVGSAGSGYDLDPRWWSGWSERWSACWTCVCVCEVRFRDDGDAAGRLESRE